MYTIKTQKDSNVTALIACVMVLAGMRFFATLWMAARSEAITLAIVLLILYGLILLGSIFLLIRLVKTRRHKLTLNENGMIYMPLFGAPKSLSYNDLQKISIGGKMYVLYSRDGRKLAAFDDFHMENASEIIAFLKQKGVRTEI